MSWSFSLFLTRPARNERYVLFFYKREIVTAFLRPPFSFWPQWHSQLRQWSVDQTLLLLRIVCFSRIRVLFCFSVFIGHTGCSDVVGWKQRFNVKTTAATATPATPVFLLVDFFICLFVQQVPLVGMNSC